MFKNMTIKMKLLVSFGLIAVLVATMAGYAIYGINQGANGFSSYREMARDSVLASRVQANMLMARMKVINYMQTSSQKDINEFNEYFDKTESFMQTAKEEIQNPERVPMVKKIDEELIEYEENFRKVVEFMNRRNDVVQNNLNANGKKIEQLLTSVMETAKEDGDTSGSLATAEGIRTLLLARIYTVKYLLDNKLADAKRVDSEFKELDNLLAGIRAEIQNPTRRAQLKEAMGLIETYRNGVDEIVQLIADRNDVIDNKLNVLAPDIAKVAEDLKLSIKADQDKIGPEVKALNDNLKTVSLTIAAIVLILVVALGFIIPRTIANQIATFQKGLLGFFSFLNKETDKVENVALDSKDEIGTMAQVVNENIEKTRDLIEQDNAVLEDVKRVVEKVDQGYLDQSVQKSTDNEGLNALKDNVNNMLETLQHNVCKDVNKLSDVLESFKRLDFRPKVENDDGRVAQGVNELSDVITNMLQANRENGLTLQESAAVLLKNVNTLTTSANQQAASLEETSASMEEISGNVQSNTDKAVSMSNSANEAMDATTQGKKLADQTVTSMESINEAAKKIAEAVNVIDSIAFQTNILSLNAAVEAANAGEAGKGFAVVAQEVRNLASRSANAAQEIQEIATQAQEKTSEGEKISADMLTGFNDIDEKLKQTLQMVQEVTDASKEQMSGIEQVNDALAQLDEATQENAKVANETNSIAQSTDEIALDVVRDTEDKEFEGKDKIKAKKIETAQTGPQKQNTQTKKPQKQQNEESNAGQKQHGDHDANDDDEWESF